MWIGLSFFVAVGALKSETQLDEVGLEEFFVNSAAEGFDKAAGIAREAADQASARDVERKGLLWDDQDISAERVGKKFNTDFEISPRGEQPADKVFAKAIFELLQGITCRWRSGIRGTERTKQGRVGDPK